MALQDSGIFMASSLIADTPVKDKENAEPTGDTPAGGKRQRSGEGGGSRSARKSLLGRRRSSVGRRLSGFGGGGFDANADQSKLASMYSSIIKLNSENKITREKCWGLHLIDYMDRVIMDEGGQLGGSKVNFQKASCTLDASVKIYSHRVDATHMSSYTLLDNLNRSDDKPDEKGAGGGAAVGSSERSARLGVHETLKKADQLSQSETDRAFKVDPMFHKMSKIFDEAGSKGMLLNNLSVSDGCKVSFDSESATAPPSPEKIFRGPEEVGGEGDKGSCEKEAEPVDGEEGNAAAAAAAAEVARGMTNIKELRSTLFSICGDLGDLATLVLCPQLQEFRDQIAELEETPKERASLYGGRAHGDGGRATGDDSDSDGDGAGGGGGGGGGGFDDIPGSDGASYDGGGDHDGDGDNAEVLDFVSGGSEDADPFQADNGDGFGGDVGISFLDNGDGNGEGDFDDGLGSGGAGVGVSGIGGRAVSTESGVSTMAVTPVSLEDRLCVDMKIVNDDYAFYDTGALAEAAASSKNNNNWAGASHWKFVGVKKKRPVRELQASEEGDGHGMDGMEDNAGIKGGRVARGKRKPPAIDFDAPPLSENALAPPPKPKSRGKRAQEPTLLSEDYIKRALKSAQEGSSNYALPENAGFKPKDLGELFLRPGAFTKRWAACEAGGVADVTRVDLEGFRHSNGDDGGGGSDDDLLFADANDGYGGGDDMDDDDDDDDEMGSGRFLFGGFEADGENSGARGIGEGAAVVGADGVVVDKFEGQGLLSAGRRVEKISVNYARKAKKVDVRRLKGDLWRKIQTEFQSDASAARVIDVGGDKEEVRRNWAETKEDNRDNDKSESPERGNGKEEDDEEEEGETKPFLDVVDMTFSDIVFDVSSREEQPGVTVPFYFICLLHLANEKGLKLEGRDDLLDFSVASDPVKAGSY